MAFDESEGQEGYKRSEIRSSLFVEQESVNYNPSISQAALVVRFFSYYNLSKKSRQKFDSVLLTSTESYS